jgi:hypothetical protein
MESRLTSPAAAIRRCVSSLHPIDPGQERLIVNHFYTFALVLLLFPLAVRAEGPRGLGCNFNVNVPHAKELAERPITLEELHRNVQKGNGPGEQVSAKTCAPKGDSYREVADLQVMFVTIPDTVCK